MRKLVMALALILAVTTAARAQGTTSRVGGTVTDKSGGAVPGASVTLTSDGTAISLTTTTNQVGNYSFEAVQVGRYTLAVELQGFKRFVAPGVNVSIGEPAIVNAVMEPGGVAETVEVSAATQIVQTGTSGNLGSTFDQRTIESLPILGTRGRNPAGTGPHSARRGLWRQHWRLRARQRRARPVVELYARRHRLERVERRWRRTSRRLRTNPDALSEFKVLTGNQTAEYGRNSGGQVAMVTRSGSNQLTGHVFYFDRRPDYNANEWENNIDGLDKRLFTQKMPGFSVGGPIRRNKTFFFVNNQWLRASRPPRHAHGVHGAARQGIWRYSTGGRNQPAGSQRRRSMPTATRSCRSAPTTFRRRSAGARARSRRFRRSSRRTPLPNNFTTGDGLNTAGFTFSALEAGKADGLRHEDRSHLQQQPQRLLPLLEGIPEHAVRPGERRRARVSRTRRASSTRSAIRTTGPATGAGIRPATSSTSWSSARTTSRLTSSARWPTRRGYSLTRPVTLPESYEVGNLRSDRHVPVRRQPELAQGLAQLPLRHQHAVPAPYRYARLGRRRQCVTVGQLRHARSTRSIRATFGIPSNIQVGERSPGPAVEHQLPARTRRHPHSGIRPAGRHLWPGRDALRLQGGLSRRSTSTHRTPGSRART